jgi:hypothetical protein
MMGDAATVGWGRQGKGGRRTTIAGGTFLFLNFSSLFLSFLISFFETEKKGSAEAN